tara:strand:+ start:113 stop:586 length:474 start_codon:yes stop_codon:yes gene_type:complete
MAWGGSTGQVAQQTQKRKKKKAAADEKAAWLKKTRNSPAARSGAFSDDERWAMHKKSRSKATSKPKTSKSSTSEVKRPVGGIGGRKSRYSQGVNTPEKRAADKKRQDERETRKKERIARSQAKGRRRGTGVRTSSKSTPQKKKKRSNLRITTWRDLE